MPDILNVVVGIVFVYLIFSLLVSALNELILGMLDKRAAFLQEGLRELLQDDNRITNFLHHGLVDAMSRKTGGDPSYIGPDAFVAAALDLILPAEPGKVRTIADLESAVAKLPNDKFRQSITALLDSAAGDLDRFKKNLTTWWDHSMQRVSGWYTRYTQKWLFCLGLILAVACNVDSIHITQVLSSDPKLAVATADQAVNFIKAHPKPTPTPTPGAAATPAAAAMPVAAAPTSSPERSGANPAAQPPAVAGEVNSLVDKVESNLANLTDLRMPIGWNFSARQHFGILRPKGWGQPENWGVLFSAICGWLLTALAATLGAPFWFDTLQRFVNIRGNGRAPNEKDPTAKG